MTAPFEKITAIFFRENMFYPIEFSGTKDPIEEAADHAKCNPGTLRIETVDGEVLWSVTVQ
jgi:hypothetical protein